MSTATAIFSCTNFGNMLCKQLLGKLSMMDYHLSPVQKLVPTNQLLSMLQMQPSPPQIDCLFTNLKQQFAQHATNTFPSVQRHCRPPIPKQLSAQLVAKVAIRSKTAWSRFLSSCLLNMLQMHIYTFICNYMHIKQSNAQHAAKPITTYTK